MNDTLWSLDLALDLLKCDQDKFNEEDLKSMAQGASKILDPNSEIIGVVTEFGAHNEDMEGLRLVHENQNSLLTGHFVNKTKKAYLNVHSCNPYKPSELIEYLSNFFNCESYKVQKMYRD